MQFVTSEEKLIMNGKGRNLMSPTQIHLSVNIIPMTESWYQQLAMCLPLSNIVITTKSSLEEQHCQHISTTRLQGWIQELYFAGGGARLMTASAVHKLSEYCVQLSVYILPNKDLLSRHVIGTEISL